MKLSMWMIANRLRNIDLTIHIGRNAPVHLKSARMVYSTDCVHVYQKGKDVFCEDNGNIIIFRDADLIETFNLIQSVFDYYQDLASQLEIAVADNDLQDAVDALKLYFRNPLVVLDTDMQFLAHSSHYSTEDLGANWKFLVEPHYPSSVGLGLASHQNIDNFFKPNTITSCRLSSNTMTCECYTVAIFQKDSFLGRVALLEDSYPLNKGDAQLLNWFAAQIAPLLEKLKTGEYDGKRDILLEAAMGTKIRPRVMNEFIAFHGWRAQDGFLVYVFIQKTPYQEYSVDDLQLDLYFRMNACHVSVINNQLMAVINTSKTSVESFLAHVEKLTPEQFNIGRSLPFQSIYELKYAYNQALSAIEYAKRSSYDSIFADFYDFALDFMIDSNDLDTLFHAASPDIRFLWKNDRADNKNNLGTLVTFLNNERSISQSAREEGVHKNTFLYRIRKIEEGLSKELTDPYYRHYLIQSIRILRLYQTRMDG